MYLPTVFLSAFALLASAVMSAVCDTPGNCLKIIELSSTSPSGRPGNVNDITVAFTLWDDTPITNATTQCEASWDYTTQDWPASYVLCDDDNFEWDFSRFDSISNFAVDSTHGYENPAVGEPDYVRAFASGNVTRDDLDCETAASGASSCWLKDGHVIGLPIYAMTA